LMECFVSGDFKAAEGLGRTKRLARASTTGITTLLMQRRKEKLDVTFMMNQERFTTQCK
jgi:hypothetical protein